MAELTTVTGLTRVGGRVSHGKHAVQTYRVTITNAAAADEWFKTDFSSVLAVIGSATLGTALSSVNFVMNVGTGTTGTNGTEGANPGSLAIEASVAAQILVTVMGVVG